MKIVFRKKKKEKSLLSSSSSSSSSSSNSSNRPLSWSENILNDENYWLKANNMEDDGNLAAASEFYIIDAIKSVNNNYFVKTALSCSCAADCLNKLGYKEEATQLYSLSASLYEKNSELKIKTSIRESLWSLEQAYLNFFKANQIENSKKIYNRLVLMATKISPAFHFEDALNILQIKELPETENYEIYTKRNKIVNEKSYLQKVNEFIDYLSGYLQNIDQNDNIL